MEAINDSLPLWSPVDRPRTFKNKTHTPTTHTYSGKSMFTHRLELTLSNSSSAGVANVTVKALSDPWRPWVAWPIVSLGSESL